MRLKIQRPLTHAVLQYRMYLFERILLCCKEANQNKQKTGKKQTPLPPDRKVKPKLVLSGRIFMQNVTETISVAKPGRHEVLATGKSNGCC